MKVKFPTIEQLEKYTKRIYTADNTILYISIKNPTTNRGIINITANNNEYANSLVVKYNVSRKEISVKDVYIEDQAMKITHYWTDQSSSDLLFALSVKEWSTIIIECFDQFDCSVSND